MRTNESTPLEHKARIRTDRRLDAALQCLHDPRRLLDLGRPREAEPLLRESLELRRQSLPPGHWLISSSESMLGACLTAEGRYAEAEALLLRAHAGLESSRGHDHERTIEARRRLVALYEVWGRPDRAAAWRGTSR